jgi:N-methylhydantoinase A
VSLEVPIYRRIDLSAGNRITGPALIEESSSTTFLPPMVTAEVDRFDNLVIDVISP